MFTVNENFYVLLRMKTEFDVSDVIFVTGWTEWKNKE